MYQQTTIIGNVGRAPEMRYTPAGSAVCDFSVAVNETWTDRQTNERKEKTTWMKVTCWGNLAEIVNEHVTKGMQVMVVGTIDASAWTAEDGTARASLELTARTVKFLGSRADRDNADHGGQPSHGADATPNVGDIPF